MFGTFNSGNLGSNVVTSASRSVEVRIAQRRCEIVADSVKGSIKDTMLGSSIHSHHTSPKSVFPIFSHVDACVDIVLETESHAEKEWYNILC